MNGLEAGVERFGGEARPATVGGGEVLVHDREAGPVAVQAGALLGLDLEQFEHPHRLTRGRRHPTLAAWRRQHDPGCLHVEHLDAVVSETGEEVDDVEVVDQGVGKLYEGPGERYFSGHRISRPSRNRLPDASP